MFSLQARTKGNQIKEDSNMNMSRHIFSFKSVIFFALVAFLGRRGSVLDLVLA